MEFYTPSTIFQENQLSEKIHNVSPVTINIVLCSLIIILGVLLILKYFNKKSPVPFDLAIVDDVLSWKCINDPRVIFFVLYYDCVEDSTEGQIRVDVFNNVFEYTPVNENDIVYGKTYILRMASVTKMGVSEKSLPITYAPALDIPLPVPDNLRIVGTMLYWDCTPDTRVIATHLLWTGGNDEVVGDSYFLETNLGTFNFAQGVPTVLKLKTENAAGDFSADSATITYTEPVVIPPPKKPGNFYMDPNIEYVPGNFTIPFTAEQDLFWDGNGETKFRIEVKKHLSGTITDVSFTVDDQDALFPIDQSGNYGPMTAMRIHKSGGYDNSLQIPFHLSGPTYFVRVAAINNDGVLSDFTTSVNFRYS